jgi:hypothetical protein
LISGGVYQVDELFTFIGNKDKRVCIAYIEKEGIPLSNVRKIYSELELCELNSGGVGVGGCKKMVFDKIGPDVEIRYSYDYPGSDNSTKPLRQASLNQRRLDFEKLK